MKQEHLGQHRSAIESMFAPRSVALISASETAGSVSRALTENLRVFKGRVHFINPHKERVLDVTTCAAIGKVAEPVVKRTTVGAVRLGCDACAGDDPGMKGVMTATAKIQTRGAQQL